MRLVRIMHTIKLMVKDKRGFTIVEIIIVIVIIAVLAAIAVVSYNGLTRRAQDSIRSQDLASILKAINLYKLHNGRFPVIKSTTTLGGWDSSSVAPDTFLSELVPGEARTVPIDPVNDDGIGGGKFGYRYYLYGAGGSGCDPAKGRFFVLVGRTDNNTKKLDGHEGFKCPDRNWENEGSWVVGGFEKP